MAHYPLLKRSGIAAVCFCALLMGSSCGLIELRDATVSDDVTVDPNQTMLSQAEKKTGYDTNAISSDVGSSDVLAITAVPEAAGPVETAGADGTDPEAAAHDTVRLVFTGDSVFDPSVVSYAASLAREGRNYSFLRIYSGVYQLISEADLSVGLCGTPIFTEYEGVGAPREALDAMMALGFDALDLACPPLMTTVETLPVADGFSTVVTPDEAVAATLASYYDAGMMNYGVYTDGEDYNNIRMLDANGMKVALLAVSGTKHGDTALVPGFDDEEALASWIAYADFQSDLVVVSVDWGEKGAPSGETGDGSASNASVTDEQRRLARRMAEAGADVIVGGGGSLRNVEMIDTGDGTTTLCAYSLGSLLACGEDGTAGANLGGVLSCELYAEDGMLTMEHISVTPVCTHYNETRTEIQSMTLSDYEKMVSSDGGDVALANELYAAYEARVPAELRLPADGESAD